MADTTAFGATAATPGALTSASPLFLAELACDEREFAAACLKFHRRFGPDAASQLLRRLDELAHTACAGPQAT